ncbi:MAG: protein kinase [Pseudonocardiales bacterium]|nr:protein kinase [Pseudonocardiales bacterium]
MHRDVKPGNVLVSHDGVAKLVDFGIARASGDITVTQTGVLTGTPDYFAPEVARGGKPTPEADIFALGATLYICVEGQPPFGTNKNVLTQLQVVADGTIRPPRQACQLTSVLLALLAADPGRRPDARRAATLLRAVADGTPSTPAPRPTADPMPAPEADPLTTKIPPPRTAPESWLPPGRALPPTPRELAAISTPIPTGRAAHRLPALDARRRLTVIALIAVAACAVLTAAMLSMIAGRDHDIVPLTPIPDAVVGAPAPARIVPDSELTNAVRSYFALPPRDSAKPGAC